MKSSTRNQFAGTIKAVELAPVSAQAVIEVDGGPQIVATMTRAAAERLKLKPGVPAIALIKASAIALISDFDGYVLSARNQFAGKVTRVERGAVTSLVTVSAGGAAFAASVTNDAVDEMALKPGSAVTAAFKAYSVMVAARA